MRAYLETLLLWAALHVAWQGAVLGVAYAAWERRKLRAAAERYRVAVACVAAMAAAFVVNPLLAHAALVVNGKRAVESGFVGGASASSVMVAIDGLLYSLKAFAAVWLIGVAIGSARVVLAWMSLRRIRRSAMRASPELVERVAVLSQRLGVETVPDTFTCAHPGAPFVIGTARPALMLPALWPSDDEHDALLLHELAHVSRGDLRGNAWLVCAQVMLWFHPAVWTLTRAAVNAREEACDDVAAAHVRSALVVARALVVLEERRLASGALLAANGGSLARRIRRLIVEAREPATSRRMNGWWALAVVAAGCIAAFALAPGGDVLPLAGASASAVPAVRNVIDAHDPAGRFTVTLLNGHVAGATVGGAQIARSAIARRGPTVSVMGSRGEQLVSVQLVPGGIEWTPRKP